MENEVKKEEEKGGSLVSNPFLTVTRDDVKNIANAMSPEVQRIMQKVMQSQTEHLAPVEFTLPGAILYPKEKQSIKVSPLLGKHEKLLATSLVTTESGKGYDFGALIGGIARVLNERISYMDGSSFISEDLSLQDFLAVYFLISFISHPIGKYTSAIKCQNPECNVKEYVHTLRQEDISVDELSSEKYNIAQSFELPYSKLKMKLKTLSTRDLMGSMSGSKSGKQLLSLYVDSIDDAKVNGEIVEQVVGGLLLDDLDTLTSHAYKIMDYGISVYVKSKCYCGHENEVSIYKYYGGQDVRLPFRFNPGVASES